MQILDSPHHFSWVFAWVSVQSAETWLTTTFSDCWVLHRPVFTVQRQNSPPHFLFSSTQACVHCAETELTTPFSVQFYTGLCSLCRDRTHHTIFCSVLHWPVFTVQRQNSPHHFLFSSTQACVYCADRTHHTIFYWLYTGLCSPCRETGLTKPFSVGFHTGLCSWRKGGLEDCWSNDLSCRVPKTHTQSPKALERRRRRRRITLT